jgi:Tfp pilus assembly protein PilO
MSDGGNEQGDDLEFAYSPEQRLTTEQRIEVLESQVAEMREQIGALLKQLPWLSASRKN